MLDEHKRTDRNQHLSAVTTSTTIIQPATATAGPTFMGHSHVHGTTMASAPRPPP